MSEKQSAFEVLAGLAQQTRSHARGLPSQVNIQPHWSGIGFGLLGRHFVAPMGQIAEMLEVPVSTRLPGVKPWVRGVANVRGRLLPIMDLAAFLGGRLSSSRKQHRVLILDTDSFYSGLMVDQVYGMQHFPVDSFMPADVDESPQLNSLVDGSYLVGGTRWTVFNLTQLTDDVDFSNAASL